MLWYVELIYLQRLIICLHIAQLDDPYEHYEVRAKLAVFDKQFKLAETIYLEQGRISEAMDMYQEMHKWDESIKVAEVRNHPDLETLKHNYFSWLVESGQEERAGKINIFFICL